MLSQCALDTLLSSGIRLPPQQAGSKPGGFSAFVSHSLRRLNRRELSGQCTENTFGNLVTPGSTVLDPSGTINESFLSADTPL